MARVVVALCLAHAAMVGDALGYGVPKKDPLEVPSEAYDVNADPDNTALIPITALGIPEVPGVPTVSGLAGPPNPAVALHHAGQGDFRQIPERARIPGDWLQGESDAPVRCDRGLSRGPGVRLLWRPPPALRCYQDGLLRARRVEQRAADAKARYTSLPGLPHDDGARDATLAVSALLSEFE